MKTERIENDSLLNKNFKSACLSVNPKAVGIGKLLEIWKEHIPTSLQKKCHFVKDMEKTEQQNCLGLLDRALDRALNRFFSLPFIFTGSATQRYELEQSVAQVNLSVQRGGRVFNLSGCHDKADYLSDIRRWAKEDKASPLIIGLGDGKNDIEMLKQVDISCVIPRKDGTHLSLGRDINPTIVAPRVAPLGWLDAARRVVSLFSLEEGVKYG